MGKRTRSSTAANTSNTSTPDAVQRALDKSRKLEQATSSTSTDQGAQAGQGGQQTDEKAEGRDGEAHEDVQMRGDQVSLHRLSLLVWLEMRYRTQDEISSRAARKSARKAAKAERKAARAAASSVDTATEKDDGADEGDERARKKARKAERKAEKERKRAEKGEKAGEVDPAPSTTVSTTPSAAASVEPAEPSEPSKKDKKKKKDKDGKEKRSKKDKSKDKAAVAVVDEQPQVVQEQPHEHPYGGPTDPALAGLLMDLEASLPVPPAHAGGDIPVFGNYSSMSNYPSTSASAAYPALQPSFYASHYHHPGDIPVDPQLLRPAPAPSASTSAGVGAAFGPLDPSLAHAHEDSTHATARALMMAQQQHKREMAERHLDQGGRKGKKRAKTDEDEDDASTGKKSKKSDRAKGKLKAKQPDSDYDDDALPAPLPRGSVRIKPPSTPAVGAGAGAVKVAAPGTSAAVDRGAASEFYEQLVTRWIPVKELKQLTEDYGATYKQGKFSAAEDVTIRAALESYRQDKGLTQDDLARLMTSKRDTKSASSSSSSSASGAVVAATNANEAWERIARALGDRSLLAIYNHVKRLLAPEVGVKTGGAWTAEEDAALRSAVKELGNAWEEIAKRVGTRSGGACRDRWVKQLGGGETTSKKGKWSEEEEQQLTELVGKYGSQWAVISKKMGGTRLPTQCRTKWNDFLVRRDKSGVAADPEGAADEDASNDWRWKSAYGSSLIHAVAALHVAHESEIDWRKIDDPVLKRHGPKNLRDRFRHLADRAKEKIAERSVGGVKREEVSFTDALDYLLKAHPTPGLSIPRASSTAASSSSSTKTKSKTKSASSSSYKKKASDASDRAPDGGKWKSSAVVESSDEEGSSDDEDAEDPLAEFNKGLASQLAAATA
ncbi:hypothetical protein JCM8097_003268 [Rhodosporidiobolus ruineniae]